MTDRVWRDKPDKPGLWWFCNNGGRDSMRVVHFLKVHDFTAGDHIRYTPVLPGDLPEPPPPEKPKCCPWCGEVLCSGDSWLCGSTFDGSESLQSDACKLRVLREAAKEVLRFYEKDYVVYDAVAIANLRKAVSDDNNRQG